MRPAGRAAWWLFAVAVVANLLLLFWPRSPGTAGIPHLDKAVHLVSFAFVTWTGHPVPLGTLLRPAWTGCGTRPRTEH